jgi:hypothetical protein
MKFDQIIAVHLKNCLDIPTPCSECSHTHVMYRYIKTTIK